MTGDSASQPLAPQIILIIILTLVNALFAAAEMAFVNVDKHELEEEADSGNKSAARVLRLLDDSDDFLSTIQIAITLAGFLNSASAATNVANRITPFLEGVAGAQTIAIIIVTIIISYITLVFGELYPKTLALQMPNAVAKFSSGIVNVMNIIFKPIIWLLSASVNLLKTITPIDFTKTEEPMTRDEFRAFLDRSHKDKAIDLDEFSMLQGVLDLDHKMVREIMVPRTESYMIDYDDGAEANIDKLLDLQYSRVPLYYQEKDNIMGIIHIKNLLRASTEKPLYEVDLNDIMNEALHVPETIYVDDLLYEMQRTNNSMVIVTDEYGGVSGIVTLEDIVEEIVGDIEDEYDEASNLDIQVINEHEFVIEGSMALHDFNNYFNTAISSEAVDTIAGYFIIETGVIPMDSEGIIETEADEDDVMNVDKFRITLNEVDGTRITSLKVEEIPEEELKAVDDISDNIPRD